MQCNDILCAVGPAPCDKKCRSEHQLLGELGNKTDHFAAKNHFHVLNHSKQNSHKPSTKHVNYAEDIHQEGACINFLVCVESAYYGALRDH